MCFIADGSLACFQTKKLHKTKIFQILLSCNPTASKRYTTYTLSITTAGGYRLAKKPRQKHTHTHTHVKREERREKREERREKRDRDNEGRLEKLPTLSSTKDAYKLGS